MIIEIDEIEPEDVQESTDEAFLHEVHSAYLRKIESAKDRLEAAGLAGTADQDWVSRTGGFISVCKRIVKTARFRCDELGLEPPYDWLSHMEAKADMKRREAHDAGMTRAALRKELAEWLLQPEQSKLTAAEVAAAIVLRRYE